jgi:cobalt-precorrin-5B (C1)-methyltransferase
MRDPGMAVGPAAAADAGRAEGKECKASPRRGRGNRSGFTTGACAAAAARAATLGLVSGEVPAVVQCFIPNGVTVTFRVLAGRVEGSGTARVGHAVVVKDAGDDPDATNGAHLTADVAIRPDAGGQILLQGGPGVGTVTLAGLGLEIGSPAINPVPRRNISDNVRAAAGHLLDRDGLVVTISVPGGEAMAKKTLNARLGILGGISILGTTGIVRPYSTAAFRASVVQAVEVAAAQGRSSVVFTTGGRTEKCAMAQYPALSAACFVQMGDFVKAAFDAAVKAGIAHVVLGAMVGKLTKIAQGLPVTHAWRKEIDRRLLAEAAALAGAPPALVAEIAVAETGRFAAERLEALGLSIPFHRELARRAIASLTTRYRGRFRLTVLVVDFEGRPIVTVEEEDFAQSA